MSNQSLTNLKSFTFFFNNNYLDKDIEFNIFKNQKLDSLESFKIDFSYN